MSEKLSSKQVVGEAAATYVKSGMRLGLGTGSTVHYFLKALAARIQKDALDVQGVCTSLETEKQCCQICLQKMKWKKTSFNQ